MWISTSAGNVSVIGAAFFFSSRRRHTRWPRDWSSDVCSSDLNSYELGPGNWVPLHFHHGSEELLVVLRGRPRSEERRVGKECRFRWSAEHWKKKALRYVLRVVHTLMKGVHVYSLVLI